MKKYNKDSADRLTTLKPIGCQFTEKTCDVKGKNLIVSFTKTRKDYQNPTRYRNSYPCCSISSFL